MNDETYSECIVPARRSRWVIPAWTGLALSALAMIYFLFCENGILAFVFLVVSAIIIFILVRFGSLEYEYLYLMGELTVDKIYRKSSRRNAAVVSMQDVETILPTEDSDAERMRGSGSQVEYLDYSSGRKDQPTYTIKYVSGGKTHFMRFEPNEKMLKQMRHSHPGKVHIRR